MKTSTLAMMAVLGVAIATSDPVGADSKKKDSEPALVEPWVGTWSGKVTWKGCSDDGVTTVSLDVGLAPAGGLVSVGAALLDGVGELAWVRRGKALGFDGTEVDASLTQAKKGAKLVVTTAAGCVGKGTLTRPSSGMVACDSVRVLATIKAQCGSGDDLVAVEAAWAGWSRLKGKKKTAQTKACTRQRDTLRADVASCESSGPGFTTGVVECDRYLAASEKFVSCDKVPQASRDATRQGLDAMRGAWGDMSTMPPEAQKAAADACKQATDALNQASAALGCPI